VIFDVEAIVRTSKTVTYDFRSDLLKKLDAEFSGYFLDEPSYYKLLTATARLYPDAVFLELGTYTGASAIAYAYGNPNKPIYTYDVVSSHRFIHEGLKDKIIVRKADVRTCQFDMPRPDIIFLDISHNGTDEIATLNNLVAQSMIGNNMLILDDIMLNNEMKLLWSQLRAHKKFDITAHGHPTGTGVCLYE